MLQVSRYPPISDGHPWRVGEEKRLHAIESWRNHNIDKANVEFIAAIKESPEFPFLWSTYLRFLCDTAPDKRLAAGGIVHVAPDQFLSGFSMHRFFDRCQVASALISSGWNGFERPCPAVIARWMRASGGLFCDVGANSGFYSLLAASAGALRVIAFEPFASARDVMRSNAELNAWQDRIQIRQQALSDSTGTSQFFLPPQHHGLLETSASRDPNFRSQHSLAFAADTVTLDSLLDDGIVRVGDALTIKVDVEGVGPTVAVINGARKLAQQVRPVMMVEYFEGSADELNRFVSDLRYECFVAHPNGQLDRENRLVPQLDQLNHFLIPSERVSDFLRAVVG